MSKPPNILNDSSGRTPLHFSTILEAFDWINEPFGRSVASVTGEKGCVKVAWDIDEFCAPIWQLLSKEQAQRLLSTTELQFVIPVKDGGNFVYRIKYVPQKFLALECKGEDWSSTIYHMKQYVPDNFVPKDPQELEAFTRTVISAAQKLGFYPHSLFSTASIISTYLKRLDLPQPEDAPEEANVYALRCADKTWREAHLLGFFKATQYDLRSAYPRVHAELRDYRFGKWEHKTIYDPTALYGYCNCRITIFPKVKVSPFIYRNPNTEEEDRINLFSPTGSWDDFLTLSEIRFLLKYKLGEVTIKDAYYFYPSFFSPQPMKEFISRLLRAKEQAGDGDITKRLAKGFLVSSWGLTRQVKENRVGDLFNPIYSAEITSTVRLKVARMIYAHKIHPIHIITDGFGCEEKITLSPEEIAEGWAIDYEGPLINISTGLFYYEQRHPGGLRINEVRAMIKHNPQASYYQKTKMKIVTLGDALKFKALDTIGQKHKYITSIDLNGIEHNRYFPKEPRNGEELMTKHFTSSPYDIEEISKEV